MERTALEQPLPGGADTVEKPIVGRLVAPGGAIGQQSGGGAGVQARTGGAADAANEVVNVPTNPAPKSTDIERVAESIDRLNDKAVETIRRRVKEADQERLPDSVKTQIRRKLKK